MKRVIVILFMTATILMSCDYEIPDEANDVFFSPVSKPTPTPEKVCIFSIGCFYR